MAVGGEVFGRVRFVVAEAPPEPALEPRVGIAPGELPIGGRGGEMGNDDRRHPPQLGGIGCLDDERDVFNGVYADGDVERRVRERHLGARGCDCAVVDTREGRAADIQEGHGGAVVPRGGFRPGEDAEPARASIEHAVRTGRMAFPFDGAENRRVPFPLVDPAGEVKRFPGAEDADGGHGQRPCRKPARERDAVG